MALDIIIASSVVVKPAIVAVAREAAVSIDTAGVGLFVAVVVSIVGAFVNIGSAVIFVKVFVAGVTFAVNAWTCGCGVEA